MKKRILTIFLSCFFILAIFFIQRVLFEKRALSRGEILTGENIDNKIEMVINEKNRSRLVQMDVDKLIASRKEVEQREAQKADVNKPDEKPVEGAAYELKDNGTDFKSVFKDSLFIGDSISNGLLYYKHLSPENVMAIPGQSIKTTRKKLDDIKKKNPKNIYIMLGMNDSTYTELDAFKNAYAALVEEIQANLPNTKIYLQSVLNVNPKNEKATARISNAKIDSFNDAIAAIAKDKSLKFIDLRPFLQKNPAFYEPDGVHVNVKFYRTWLQFIQTNYFEVN